MKLVPNWRRVLLHSFALWCVYAAGLLELLPYLVPYLDDYLPHWLSIAALLASPLGRVIDQGNIHADK
jgi:hypothetical protein